MLSTLSDNDRKNTRIEGKRLKKRKVRFAEEYLEITEDGPAVGLDAEIEQQEEFVTDVESDKEGTSRKELKRRKKEEEMLIAAGKKTHKSQIHDEIAGLKKDIEKMEAELDGKALTPDKEIEQIREAAITKLETTRPEREANQEHARERKNDMPAAEFLLGDNANHLDFTAEIAEKAENHSTGLLDTMYDAGKAATEAALQFAKPVKPANLPDIRGREADIGMQI